VSEANEFDAVVRASHSATNNTAASQRLLHESMPIRTLVSMVTRVHVVEVDANVSLVKNH